MNFCHTVSSARSRRIGDGVSSSSFKIRRTDDRPSCNRSLRSSPMIRRYPPHVLLGQANDDFPHIAGNPRPPDPFRPPPFPQFHHPPGIRLRRYDADDLGHVVVEFPADCQQPCPVIRAGNDTVAAELAAEYIDLSLQEPDAGVPTCSARLSEEVHSDVEPVQHDT
jgi:hypothetical protein